MQSRDELHEAINRLTEDQALKVMGVVRRFLYDGSDPVVERLSAIPGIRMPASWPPRFKPVRPLSAEGELASDRLIRERR
jgi:hypothetical protein